MVELAIKSSARISTLPKRSSLTYVNYIGELLFKVPLKLPGSLISFKHHCEGFGGDVNFAKALHALFSFGLLGEHLLFATHITTV